MGLRDGLLADKLETIAVFAKELPGNLIRTQILELAESLAMMPYILVTDPLSLFQRENPKQRANRFWSQLEEIIDLANKPNKTREEREKLARMIFSFTDETVGEVYAAKSAARKKFGTKCRVADEPVSRMAAKRPGAKAKAARKNKRSI